jgi:hypothetical protein
MTDLDDDAPIRLSEAARRCFPDGTLSASGLRRLADKGLLAIERINGRDYTTLHAIKEMREKCRVAPRVRTYGFAQADAIGTGKIMAPSGSSSIADAKSRLAALLTNPPKQNGHSATTLRRSINGK